MLLSFVKSRVLEGNYQEIKDSIQQSRSSPLLRSIFVECGSKLQHEL